MLHLKQPDGTEVYINALAVRYVLPNGLPDQCSVYFDTSGHLTIAGDARHVAETVHKGLRIIHGHD